MNKSGVAEGKAAAEKEAVKDMEVMQVQMAWAQADTEMAIEAKDVAEQAAAKAAAKAKAGLLSRVLG